jgi:hypothetical protein
MGQTLKIPADSVGADFRDLAAKIAATLAAEPLLFPTIAYKGSFSWTGNETTPWRNETIWKLAFWSRTHWSFGVREEYVVQEGKADVARPLCSERDTVSPSPVLFLLFPVKNDAASLAKIMKLIAVVTATG